jgi:hypothetical protein
MGNDVSKKSMNEDFTRISNYINERLSDFFGPIDGFKYSNSKSVPSLEKYDDPTYRVLPKDKMDALKEERQVCANLVLTYTDALNGMLSDSDFKNKVVQFVNNMKINPDRLSKLSVRLLKSRDNETICNDVINYYFLKYRIYRLINDYDPYQKEFEFITQTLEKNSAKYSQLDKNKQEYGYRKFNQLVKARDEYQNSVLKYLELLANDELTYPELEKLYARLASDKSTAVYCQAVYNICDDVENFSNSKDIKNFNFRDLSYDYEICRNINLTNVKKFSPCTKLKKAVATEDKKKSLGLGRGLGSKRNKSKEKLKSRESPFKATGARDKTPVKKLDFGDILKRIQNK